MTAYLVSIQSQRGGVEYQIWYSDGNSFVGPPLPIIEKLPIPEIKGRWKVDGARKVLDR